ncbi:MAG: 16S rRNA (adenine(1518)-N(6)/adenine(1519)-N(6))-dimethyltransferase RsmA [Salibacteraceae bacterium]|nr:16S rRNA (adenine(1518)-N(6)/adenine(1519)-N(6))-dimethyltransferase RsmA [Salibacteraceae bacterium]|tara:strand:- start:57505 stop:58263 length:759 start_codon:yes stop_codon:yes gene_type:complete
MVQPKKHLGQHFLTDESVVQKIVESLSTSPSTQVIEIGPGTGALSKYLLKKELKNLWLCEVDRESVDYLIDELGVPDYQLLQKSFLRLELSDLSSEPISIIGNFPYNISSQILFRVFDQRDQVPELVGTFQKEVGLRVAANPGSKTYGILSVLLQAFYNVEYLNDIDRGAFFPPPNVVSGVIRMKRNSVKDLGCDTKNFVLTVKTAFNQRRKTLNNALKSLNTEKRELPYGTLRAETLTVEQFVEMTKILFG